MRGPTSSALDTDCTMLSVSKSNGYASSCGNCMKNEAKLFLTLTTQVRESFISVNDMKDIPLVLKGPWSLNS